MAEIVLTMAIWLLAGMLIYGFCYLKECYNDVTLFELIYYARMPLKGGNPGPFIKELPRTALVVAGSLFISLNLYIHLSHLPLSSKKVLFFTLLPAFVIILLSVILLCHHLKVISFIRLHLQHSRLYEDRFHDPRRTWINFPKNKRNLIYIYLESMETCYSSLSGAKVDYIPELSQLAKEGITFSGEGSLCGAYAVPGATFTTGAMVAHMAGISIDLAIKDSDSFIPGMCTIGDLLYEHGYEQEFILGSDVDFGGRRPLMQQHGNYKIFDYKSARKDGHIPPDYYIWWGFEDEKLFSFAKEEVTKLASGDKPFNLTLLTVDTHFLNGCKCRLCRKQYKEQYANVLACSSRQVAGFVEWVKQQDFYENTTIVLCGDHPTMDSGFIRRSGLKKQDRRSFVTFLNAPCVPENRRRDYSTLDLFPTTLASLGITIPENRLGLGVNLFSNEKTLLEELGSEATDAEFTKRSRFYRKHLLEQ